MNARLVCTVGALALSSLTYAAETKQIEAIKAGTHKPTWFNETLVKLGCELPS